MKCFANSFFQIFLLVTLLLRSPTTYAGVNVPQNLSESDRIEALRILGFGTTSKILASPYPLGGFPGLELGLSLETVNIEDLSALGNTTKQQKTLIYPKLTIGKGLYNNFDFFLHFIPFLERTNLSEFGIILRWGFFHPTSFPVSLSTVLHANSSNIDSKITTLSFGATLIGAFHIYGGSIFVGYGHTSLKGKFIGDSSGPDNAGVTDTQQTESEKTDDSQVVVGLSYDINSLSFTLQVDRFRDNSYSGRVAYRF